MKHHLSLVIIGILAVCLLALSLSFVVTVAAQPSEPDPELLVLYAAWWDAEVDSAVESVAEQQLLDNLPDSEEQQAEEMLRLHRTLAEQRLGNEAIEYYQQYMAATIGSEEEEHAYEQFIREAKERDLSEEEAINLAEPLLWESSADESTAQELTSFRQDSQEDVPLYEPHEIGSKEALPSLEIDIKLIVAQRLIITGEPWSVLGTIHNRSDQPIWIVDRFSMLTSTPELFGQVNQVGSIAAFFPSATQRASDEIVRIDPGREYVVVWKIDPVMGDDLADASAINELPRLVQLLVRVYRIWTDYLFFIPGEYNVAADVHVWPYQPTLEKARRLGAQPHIGKFVINLGDSFVASTNLTISTEASPWVLIFGAVVGGILAFLLQILNTSKNNNDHYRPYSARQWRFWAGLLTALLLTSIGTILISRLSSSNFLINVSVRDLWGAIATGFVIQWFGFSYLSKLLPKEEDEGEEELNSDEALEQVTDHVVDDSLPDSGVGQSLPA